MLPSEAKVATTSNIGPMVIDKIHNMPWLKRDCATSTDPKPRSGRKDMMPRTLPQKGRDEQNPSKKKEHRKNRSRAKKSSLDVSQNIEMKYKNNGNSKPDRHNNGQTEKTETFVLCPSSLTLGPSESAWTLGNNASQALFPNAKEVESDEDLQRAMEESLKISRERDICNAEELFENKDVDILAERPENEDTWGKVGQNLPTTEPEDFTEISNVKNGSDLENIKNLTIPSAKLELRSCRSLSGDEQKGHYEENVKDAPLVPAGAPVFIDKYGRINGYSEKRLFMGKGARRKEQAYFQQLQLQGREQASATNVANDSLQNPGCPSKGTINAPNTQAFFQDFAHPPSHPANVLEEVDDYTRVPVQATQHVNNASKGLLDFSRGSTMQVTSTSEEIPDFSQDYNEDTERATFESNPAEEFILKDCAALSETMATTAAGKSVPSSYQVSALPIQQLTSVSEESLRVLQIKSQSPERLANLPRETRDFSRHKSDSQAGQAKKDQTQALPHEDFVRSGRPIRSTANLSNNHQKTHSITGQSVNISVYRDGNSCVRNSNKAMRQSHGGYNREPRSEQDSSKSYEHPVCTDHQNPRRDRNFSISQGETGHDEYTAARYNQNPHKFYAERNQSNPIKPNDHESFSKFGVDRNRNVYKEPTSIQSSHKFDAEYNRDSNGRPRSDRSSTKYGGEHNREYQREPNRIAEPKPCKLSGALGKNENNDYRTVRHNDNVTNVSRPKVDVPVDGTYKEPPNRSINIRANTPVEKSQQYVEEPVIESEIKFHAAAANSDATQIPEISEFNSRYTAIKQAQHLPTEIMSSTMPPASFWSAPPTPSVTDSLLALHLSQQTEINDTVSSKEESQYPSSQNCGREPYGEELVTQPVVQYGYSAPFEVKYARLRLHDPLLYKLLLQKHKQTSQLTPGKMEHFNETPLNSNCNTLLPRNSREVTDLNSANDSSGEDGCAQYQMYQQPQLPLLMNQCVSNPVDRSSHPELLSMMQDCIDSGRLTGLQYSRQHTPLGVPSPTTMQQHGNEFHGFPSAGYENIRLDASVQMHQQLFNQHYDNSIVDCPASPDSQKFQALRANCGNFTLPPPPFRPTQYVPDMVVPSDNFQGNSKPGYEAGHQRPFTAKSIHVNHLQSMTGRNQNIFQPTSRRIDNSAPSAGIGRGIARHHKND